MNPLLALIRHRARPPEGAPPADPDGPHAAAAVAYYARREDSPYPRRVEVRNEPAPGRDCRPFVVEVGQPRRPGAGTRYVPIEVVAWARDADDAVARVVAALEYAATHDALGPDGAGRPEGGNGWAYRVNRAHDHLARLRSGELVARAAPLDPGRIISLKLHDCT